MREKGFAIELSGIVVKELSESRTAPAISFVSEGPLDIDSFTNFAAFVSLVKAAVLVIGMIDN